jgi:hypothetical protein
MRVYVAVVVFVVLIGQFTSFEMAQMAFQSVIIC